MEHLKIGARYVKHFLQTGGRIHPESEQVHLFIKHVLHNTDPSPDFDTIEAVRKKLLTSNQEISITDLGAGSLANPSKTRSVRSIARTASTSQKYGRLLYHLIDYLKPMQMVELGTSLGISTLYQSLAYREGLLVTHEGCPETAAIAKKNFLNCGGNIEIRIGDFSETLPKTLQQMGQFDYAFIDGNHQREAVLHYFDQCLRFKNEGTCMVFDDIHWSGPMEEGWSKIKSHPEVGCSIDLFQLGILFFDRSEPKHHYKIRY